MRRARPDQSPAKTGQNSDWPRGACGPVVRGNNHCAWEAKVLELDWKEKEESVVLTVRACRTGRRSDECIACNGKRGMPIPTRSPWATNNPPRDESGILSFSSGTR